MWRNVNSFLKFKGVINRIFTALSAYVKGISDKILTRWRKFFKNQKFSPTAPRQKAPTPTPTTSFSTVTPTNVGTRSQIFLTFRFNYFTALVWNFKAIPSVISKLLNLNQKKPSKNWFFWWNPYKIDVMITSVINLQELPSFGHMTTHTTEFESCDKTLLVTSWTDILMP